ncbi:MAG: tocopherol cyclase family protein [Chloroflexota bacterium]
MKMKIWHPEIFQGKLRNKYYFEGWYFKVVDKTEKYAIAIIPGIALSSDNPHAFIQILSSHESAARYYTYPVTSFTSADNSFFLKIANSTFSLNKMRLSVGNRNEEIEAKLTFNNIVGWPVRLFSPGAMGWYRFVPFMECYHGVLSFDNSVNGYMVINGETIDMTGGRGYIEKDWGASMPETWIWMQTNHFSESNISLFGSIAKIPWLGSSFTGFIFGFYYQQSIYQFATYTGAHISYLEVTETNLRINVEDRNYRLSVEAVREKGVNLPAPKLGEMTSKVNESLRSVIDVELHDKRSGKFIFKGAGRNAGLEFVGNTVEMLAGLRQ